MFKQNQIDWQKVSLSSQVLSISKDGDSIMVLFSLGTSHGDFYIFFSLYLRICHVLYCVFPLLSRPLLGLCRWQ